MTDRGTGRRLQLRMGAVALSIAMLAVAGCSGGNDEGEATTTSTAQPGTTTSTTSAPTTTTPPSLEPPVIELAGYTTVYSADGFVRVSGWLDRPAEVRVGDTSVEVLDDQYDGLSTFETTLELEAGSYAIPITATDDRGLENEIYLSVLVDPTLEIELVRIEEVDLVARTLAVDDVEFLIGDEATAAARADGVIGEDEETPGGFYLRNLDPTLQTLTLGDPGVVTLQACLPDGPCATEYAVDLNTWAELLANPDMAEDELGWLWYGAGVSPYQLTIQDGIVVQIVEQYLP